MESYWIRTCILIKFLGFFFFFFLPFCTHESWKKHVNLLRWAKIDQKPSREALRIGFNYHRCSVGAYSSMAQSSWAMRSEYLKLTWPTVKFSFWKWIAVTCTCTVLRVRIWWFLWNRWMALVVVLSVAVFFWNRSITQYWPWQQGHLGIEIRPDAFSWRLVASQLVYQRPIE